MKNFTTTDYRQRIYDHYVHARQQTLAPATVEGFQPRLPYLNRMIRGHFPPDPDARILDLGCGHGAIVYAARLAGYRDVIGVDRSPQQVEEARRLGVEGVQQGDLMATLQSMPSASIDVVVAFDVIEHFKRDELLPFVDEVYRVLKTGGKWVIHVPNGESPFGSRILYSDLTHEMAFTRISIGQLLLASGFSSVACQEDAPVPHGAKSIVRLVLWKAIRLALLLYIAIETGSIDRSAVFSQNLLAVAVK